MSEDNVNTVRALHEAFDRQDIPGFLEMLGDSMEWKTPESLPWGGRFTGREEIGGFFAGLGEYFDELRVEPTELIDAGDYVIDFAVIGGRAKSGGEVKADGVFIWKFEGGKPVSFRESSDTARILEGLGRPVASTA